MYKASLVFYFVPSTNPAINGAPVFRSEKMEEAAEVALRLRLVSDEIATEVSDEGYVISRVNGYGEGFAAFCEPRSVPYRDTRDLPAEVLPDIERFIAEAKEWISRSRTMWPDFFQSIKAA